MLITVMYKLYIGGGHLLILLNPLIANPLTNFVCLLTANFLLWPEEGVEGGRKDWAKAGKGERKREEREEEGRRKGRRVGRGGKGKEGEGKRRRENRKEGVEGEGRWEKKG